MIGGGADIAELHVRVTSNGIQIANRELAKLGRTAGVTEQRTDRLTRSSVSVGRAFRTASIGVAATAAALVAANQKITGYSDRMASMEGRLKLVTSSQQELNTVYTRSLQLANATGQSVETTGSLYARLARSTEELGLSQSQLFSITKAVNQSFIVSGASAQESGAAILQLSQGLAAGALRGEELNSVMENSPRLARALADGLGVGIGQLREMGANGELTAEKVTTALMKMSGQIDHEFQQMPMIVGRATVAMRNDLLETFGAADTEPMIDAIENFRDTLADPEIKQSLQDISSWTVVQTANMANLAVETAGFVHWLSQAGETVPNLPSFGDIWDHTPLMLYARSLDELQGRATLFAREQGLLNLEFDRLGEQLTRSTGGALAYSSTVNGMVAEVQGSLSAHKQFNGVLKSSAAQQTTFNGVLRTSANERIKDGAATVTQSKKLQEYLADLKFQNSLIGKSAKEQRILTNIRKHGATADEKAAAQIREMEGALWDSSQASDDAREKAEDYVDALEFEVAMLQYDEQAQARLRAEKELGTDATEDQIRRTREASDTLYEHAKATEAAAAEEKRLADAAQEAARRTERAWGDARSTLSDFFFEIAADGDNAWETLYNGFEAMIAKMIAEAAANQIFLSVGYGANSMGWTQLGSQLIGAGSNGPTLTGLFSGVGSWFGGGGGESAADAYTSLGMSQTAPAMSTGQSPAWASLGGAAAPQMSPVTNAPAANSAAGGSTFNSAFSGMSGYAIGAGAAAYGIYRQSQDIKDNKYGWGDALSGGWFTKGGYNDQFDDVLPGSGRVGQEVVNFLHGNPLGILDEPLQKLFGDAKIGNNAAAAEFDLTKSTVDSITWGNNRSDPENVTASMELARMLQPLADSVGGSSYAGRVQVGATAGITLDGQKMGDAEEFLDVAFDRIIAGATGLRAPIRDLVSGFDGTIEQAVDYARLLGVMDDETGGLSQSLLSLIRNFQGTAEQTTQFTGAIVGLSEQAGINTVTQAIEDFTRVQPTLAEAYADQTSDLQTLIQNYDGSAAATTELSQALAANKTAAYGFATAIQAVGAELGGLATGQARYFRESVMTPEELRATRIAERDGIWEDLQSMTDIADMETAVRRFYQLDRQIFDSLGDPAKQAQAEPSAQRTEDLDAFVQGTFDTTLDSLLANQEDINGSIYKMLDETAKMQELAVEAAELNVSAAETNQDAVNDFASWVRQLQRNGIPVRFEGAGTELI